MPPLPANGRLSLAMKHILDRKGSEIFLGHLKMRRLLLHGNLFNDLSVVDARKVKSDIGDTEVLTDRGMDRFCETILPSLSSDSLGLLPVVQLDDTNDSDWALLNSFGVQTKLSPGFHVEQIRSLKRSNRQVKETARKIYQALSAYPGLEYSVL